MNNFVKRIWFGALLRPRCWICAAVNHQIVGGAIAVLLFLLTCLLYTSPSPRDVEESRMPSSA